MDAQPDAAVTHEPEPKDEVSAEEDVHHVQPPLEARHVWAYVFESQLENTTSGSCVVWASAAFMGLPIGPRSTTRNTTLVEERISSVCEVVRDNCVNRFRVVGQHRLEHICIIIGKT